MEDQTDSYKQSNSASGPEVDELSVYRDARLLAEYKDIMLSFDNNKMTRVDAWQSKVLKGTRFVPGTKNAEK